MQIDESHKAQSFLSQMDIAKSEITNTFKPGTHKDESFDVVAVNSNAWRARSYTRATQIQGWTLFFLTGFMTGFIAFCMDKLEELLVGMNKNFTQNMMSPGAGLPAGWGVFTGVSILLVSVAAAMSIFWGPGAIGSGVAETMGVVNGYNYHGFIGVNTLVTKILGVVFAVSGGMKVGKEGPLAHIGSLVGCAAIYLPLKINEPFRNDRDKRAIIAAGAGVGVSVAFGAPIGGVLFAYEVSKANSFWTFTLAWKTFMATSVANFTLTFMNALITGKFTNVTNAGLIKFGDLS